MMARCRRRSRTASGGAASVGEDGNVRVHEDITGDSSGSGMLDSGWNFSWDDCRDSDEEDTEIGKVMSLAGLVHRYSQKLSWVVRKTLGERTSLPSYLEKLKNGDKYISKQVRLFIHHMRLKRVEKKIIRT